MNKRVQQIGVLALAAGCAGACASEGSDSSARTGEEMTVNGLSATLSVTSNWGSGYCANVEVENVGSSTITTWSIGLELGGAKVQTLWNGSNTASGTQMLVGPASYNATLTAGGKTAFGFCANGSTLPTMTSVGNVDVSPGAGTTGMNSAGGTSWTGGTNATATGGASNAVGNNATGWSSSAVGNPATGGATSSAVGNPATGGASSAVGNTGTNQASSAVGNNATGGASGTVSASGTSCSVSPINPKATQQAKNLLCYLYSVYGKNVLSGQQETSWVSDPATDVNWIYQQTGKYPAVLGGDYLYPSGTTSRAQAWWNAGGIPMIRYHMGAPPNSDTYDNSKGSANIDNVLASGTAENTSFQSKLDYAATELLQLQSANVPVLWAPFHEAQPNGWFWWSKGTGAQYVALWKYMYNYLTNTKGVNNVLWLMPFSGTVDASFYPGKALADLAGPDTYETNQPFTAMFSSARSVVGSTIPIPLHETGKIPNPANMFPSAAPWLLFSVWATYASDSSKNSVSEIQTGYASSYTITRDEVPNLK